jgi:hypothetical protein
VEARGHFRITTKGTARLAAAPLHLAEELCLDLLKPPTSDGLSRKERSNLRRRLKRQTRHKSPRIVNLGRARPWELDQVSRSTWYARHRNRREHQFLGLHALLLRGDGGGLANAKREITLRAPNSKSRLVLEMQRLLERPDLKAQNVPGHERPCSSFRAIAWACLESGSSILVVNAHWADVLGGSKCSRQLSMHEVPPMGRDASAG